MSINDAQTSISIKTGVGRKRCRFGDDPHAGFVIEFAVCVLETTEILVDMVAVVIRKAMATVFEKGVNGCMVKDRVVSQKGVDEGGTAQSQSWI